MPKFDVVVGNPPYQGPNSGSNSLWKKFIKLSEELLKNRGYLIFVTPNMWLVDNKANPILKRNNLIYANLDIKKYFKGIGSTFSFFLMKKEKYNGGTIVKSNNEEFNIDFVNDRFLPTKNIHKKTISIFRKFFNPPFFKEYKEKSNNVECIRMGIKYRDYSKEKKNDYKWPCFNTDAQPIVYTKNDQFTKYKKIMFSSVSKFNPFYDNGKLGAARQAIIIFVNTDKEGENLLSFMKSKLFKFVEENSRQGGWFGMKNIPKIDLSKEWIDKELYEYFNLTQEEIDYIENSV